MFLGIVATFAWASGSSTVAATGASVRVARSSPSVVFDDPSEESAWHAEWRATQAALVENDLAIVSALLPRAGLTLVPYDEALPIAWAFADRGAPESPEAVCVRPCRVRLTPARTGVEVEIAVATTPERAALPRLEAAIHRAYGLEPDLGIDVHLGGPRSADISVWGLTPHAPLTLRIQLDAGGGKGPCLAPYMPETRTDREGAATITLRARGRCTFPGTLWSVVAVQDGRAPAWLPFAPGG